MRLLGLRVRSKLMIKLCLIPIPSGVKVAIGYHYNNCESLGKDDAIKWVPPSTMAERTTGIFRIPHWPGHNDTAAVV